MCNAGQNIWGKIVFEHTIQGNTGGHNGVNVS